MSHGYAENVEDNALKWALNESESKDEKPIETNRVEENLPNTVYGKAYYISCNMSDPLLYGC